MPTPNGTSSSTPAPVLTHLTPVLIVDLLEPCVAFWVDRFGLELENEVPGENGRLVFASLKRGAVEIMYQTRASVLQDGTVTAQELSGHSVALFFTVPSIDDVERALAGAPIVKPRHHTFYGSTEIYVKEPGGNTVGFAQNGVSALRGALAPCGREENSAEHDVRRDDGEEDESHCDLCDRCLDRIDADAPIVDEPPEQRVHHEERAAHRECAQSRHSCHRFSRESHRTRRRKR